MFDPLVIVYARPSFFSVGYWEFPLFYLLAFMMLFVVPTFVLRLEFDDIVISSLLGLNVGAMVCIASSILPFYMQVFFVIPLILYMVRA